MVLAKGSSRAGLASKNVRQIVKECLRLDSREFIRIVSAETNKYFQARMDALKG